MAIFKYKLKLKKDDPVIVIAGKYKGKESKVLKVDRANAKVVVEGVNVVKRHTKPNQANPDGGIIEKTLPIDASNVNYYCKKCKKGVRLGMKEGNNGKVRVCRVCEQELD